MSTPSRQHVPLALSLLGGVLAAQTLLCAGPARAADPVPGSDELPLRYEGPGVTDPQAPDGRLPYSPGVQNIQVYRASRKHSPSFRTAEGCTVGYTYTHHQDIACWKGRLYVAWAMGLKDEDVPPTQIMFASSRDGLTWSGPKNLFPPEMGWSLRFYFYRASSDRLLVFALGPYETKLLSEKTKRTLLVRELTADESLGEVYTLVNPKADHPPSFETCPDAGFVAACREAYACKLLLEQQDYGVFLGDRRMPWHDSANWPGGKILGRDNYWSFGKAFCFFHRADGALVGLCKLGIVTQSRDEGQTWSKPVVAGGLDVGGAKEWAQRTPDGRYVMIYPPKKGARFPMAITTSDDGISFRDMRLLHGEVPPQRYQGLHKDVGPQYLRGVAEWAGDAPTLDPSAIWVVYSVTKEDIWVSRVPVPVLIETREPANDTFENVKPGLRVPGWNTYSPIWAPVRVVQEAAAQNRCLELADREPVDYARAVRTFPKSGAVTVSFRLSAAQTDRGRLEIELLGENDTRPVRLALNDKGQVQAVNGQSAADIGAYTGGQWSAFTLKVKDGRFTLSRDGKELLKEAAFAEPSATVCALSFRTGEHRDKVAGEAKADLPNTEEPVHEIVYHLDDVKSVTP